jgi:hypothetical protein
MSSGVTWPAPHCIGYLSPGYPARQTASGDVGRSSLLRGESSRALLSASRVLRGAVRSAKAAHESEWQGALPAMARRRARERWGETEFGFLPRRRLDASRMRENWFRVSLIFFP